MYSSLDFAIFKIYEGIKVILFETKWQLKDDLFLIKKNIFQQFIIQTQCRLYKMQKEVYP